MAAPSTMRESRAVAAGIEPADEGDSLLRRRLRLAGRLIVVNVVIGGLYLGRDLLRFERLRRGAGPPKPESGADRAVLGPTRPRGSR